MQKNVLLLLCANRYRRKLLADDFRGRSIRKHYYDRSHRVGKTEIARRLAKLVNAFLSKSKQQIYGSRLCGTRCGNYCPRFSRDISPDRTGGSLPP